MTDLDVAVRSLADELRADPTVPAAEIRARGARRRVRRHLGLGVAAASALAAIVVAAGFHGGPPAPLPGGPSSSGRAATTAAEAPVGFELLNRDPRAFANSPGGSGLSGVDVTAEVKVVVHGKCAVVTSTNEPAPPEGSREAMPRVLVLPVGTHWRTTGWVGQPPTGGGAAQLTDGRQVAAGSRLTAGFTLSPRDDTTFTQVCPGTAGYAVIPRPDAISAIRPATGGTASPGSATSSASFGPGSSPRGGWVTRIENFPLAQGMKHTGDDKFTELTREITTAGALQPCLFPEGNHDGTDAIMAELSSPAGNVVRQLRLFADDREAAAAYEAWIESARSCSGVAPDTKGGAPGLTHEFAVEPLGADEALIAQIVRTNGKLYIWSGHMGLKRVGNALLTISASSEAMATPNRIAAWKAEDEKTLAALGRSMCRYAPGGCGPG